MPDTSENAHVYVFLVGIDKYKNVTPLEGCKNDLSLIEEFLKTVKFNPGSEREEKIESEGEEPLIYESYELIDEGYSNLHIFKLQDEEATYKNIIRGFRSFLGRAKGQDKVWFHYSGHGTQSTTAKVFAKLEDKYDQCLVCHDYEKNRITRERKNLLADKELAVLIHEIAGEGEDGPHVLISVDACHSEGLTRLLVLDGEENEVSRSRFFDISEDEIPERPSWRALDSYIDKYYSEKAEILADQPQIPVGKHVVLTACDDLQTAGENEKGYFTQGLIKTLTKFKGNINYADLLVRARSEVRQVKRDKQTPQFDVLGGAHPKGLFLDGTIQESEDTYEVLFVNNNEHKGWVIRCGMLDGLPQNPREFKQLQENKGKVLVKISMEEEGADVEIEIEKIGAIFSSLQRRTNKLDGLDKNKSYFASFNYFPAPLAYVKVSGEEEDVSDFLDKFADHKKFNSRHIVLVGADEEEASKSEIELRLEDEIRLIHHLFEKDVDLTYGDDRKGINKLIYDISQIVNWKRLLRLENTQRRNTFKDKISFRLNLEGREGRLFEHAPQAPLPKEEEMPENFPIHEMQGESGIPVYDLAVEEGQGGKEWDQPGYIMFYQLPSFSIKGKFSQVVNAYLFLLSSSFKISGERVDSDVLVNAGEEKEVEFARDGKRNWGLWGHPEGAHLYEQEDFIYAKLIVTDGILDYNRFMQEGIGSKGRRVRNIQQISLLNEWTTCTLKIVLKRK